MKRYLLAVFVFGAMVLATSVFDSPNKIVGGKGNFNQDETSTIKNDFAAQSVKENFGKLPLIFEENRGQTDKRVKYFSRAPGYTLFLTESAAVMSLRRAGEAFDNKSDRRGKQTSGKVDKTVLQITTVDSNPPSRIEGQDEQIGKSNYLLGEDSQKWLQDVPTFAKVRYSEIYRGVDLIYYGNGSRLEYDFVVSPGSNPKQIALKFEGAKKLEIGAEGDLLLHLEDGLVKQNKPVIYQEINGERKEIAGKYVLKNETQVGFQIDEYDISQSLVIDPVLAYATYLGSSEYEISHGIAVDAAGNSYVTGYAIPPTFPTTPGSVRPAVNSDNLTPFVAKFNPTGSALVYSTYLGGAGEGIAVDAAGNAYTTGYPHPELFTTTPGALDLGRGGVGITKLNPQGNQRIYAARFGSSGSDLPREIAIDSQGNAVVVGSAGCFTSCDFPILNAPQPTPPTQGGGGFVAKLNSTGSALVYSTYLGTGTEEIWGVDVDPAGNAYVTGNTTSFNFPTTPGAFDRTFACPEPPFCNPDSFVTKIPPAGGAFAYSTYLGGRGGERGWAIAVDDAGNAYAAGYTDGRFSGFPDEGFPTTPGAFKMFGSVEAYVTKLNPAGSALVYSTLLGGEGTSCGEERARDIDVDRLGNAYVVGLTTCNNFPVANALQSAPSSFQPEGFVTKFNPAGSGLVYSSYLGGPRYDEAYNVAVDTTGAAYITGTTSGDFQLITPGAFDTTWNCGQFCEHPDDIFVMKINGELAPLRNKIADFDGDGRSDISVFRNGNWYLQQSQAGFAATQFGISTDRLAPADYDGDGKTDIGVYRGGNWYYLQSSNNQFRAVQFGVSDDIPQAGDYDGDGKADFAVFRPSNGTWYLQQSAAGFSGIQFGQTGDRPVSADYDGDGKFDAAVYRADTWYVLQSRDGFRAVQFGVSTDTPVVGDYDGDGKSDFAVYRSGVWYLQRSAQGFAAIQFGVASDVPTPADYDGDGKTDIAVFRNGTWYLQQSTAGFASAQFGQENDVPVPSASVP
jgi:hypothetical protein